MRIIPALLHLRWLDGLLTMFTTLRLFITEDIFLAPPSCSHSSIGTCTCSHSKSQSDSDQNISEFTSPIYSNGTTSIL
ncbi:hypothetical protein C8R41DRAFT_822601 [Lentinula lateritia]|uniref:Secreted protein n=1 Tax=Lentinula lateritia TaxID=40482 RepID=A0ABQ8VMN4_9AGAR|nr:hypothetical protein C8R41DRAFT_822601 [Lentinula lateritia]